MSKSGIIQKIKSRTKKIIAKGQRNDCNLYLNNQPNIENKVHETIIIGAIPATANNI